MTRLSTIEFEHWRPDMAERTKASNRMGIIANSLKTYAHQPGMAAAMSGLTTEVFYNGTVDPHLKVLIRTITSQANGCRYCSTHQFAAIHRTGVPEAKTAELWSFESSPAFSEAERAALRFTLKLTTDHQGLSDADFDDMKRHWSEPEILEIMLTSLVMGFYNKLNDSLGLPIDDSLADFGPVALEHRLPTLTR
ncbi:MAG: carboxymuconolactone decarboxylase family protein [Vicinamibacterales bacterium]